MTSFSSHYEVSGTMTLDLDCETCRDLRYILSHGLELSHRKCVIDDDRDEELKQIFGSGYEYIWRDMLSDALDLVEGSRKSINIYQVATLQKAFDYARDLIRQDIEDRNAIMEQCHVELCKDLTYVPF